MPAIIEVCRDIKIRGRIPGAMPVTGTDPMVLIPTIVMPLPKENVAAVVEYVNAEGIVVVAIAGIGDHCIGVNRSSLADIGAPADHRRSCWVGDTATERQSDGKSGE